MKTFKEVAAEIARLQAKAEQLRKAEMQGVISRIKEAIEAYGLTAADLGFTGERQRSATGKAPARARQSAGSVGVAKYRDPASGKTWTGRGKPPDWIKSAKDRSAFLIDSASSTRRAPAKRATKTATRPGAGVAKYRDGATGKTWTGRGKPPDWIKDVSDRSAFLIDAGAASAS